MNEQFETDDFGLVAALAMRQIHPTKHATSPRGYQTFSFEPTPEVMELVTSYGTGRLQGSLKFFHAAVRGLARGAGRQRPAESGK